MNEFKKEPDDKIKPGEIMKNIESYFKELEQNIIDFEKLNLNKGGEDDIHQAESENGKSC